MVAVVLVALAAAACTGARAPTTNGLESKPAAQVQRAAAAALKGAKSVHVKGTATGAGEPGRLDLRVEDGATRGTIEMRGTSFEITTIADDTYVKADQRAWRVLGAPGSVQQLAGKWVKLSPGQVTAFEGFSLDSLAAQLTTAGSPLEPRVEQAVLHGTGARVVIVRQRDGSKLYVANTGPPYPLRTERAGKDPGEADFSEYGADFHIAAPSDPIDVEQDWLEAISKLHSQLDSYLGQGSNVNVTSRLMLQYAKTLRGCSRELARLGPPGDRLRPVYALVKQACAAYDKAAQCYVTAASIGGVTTSSADERKLEQAIDCGFSAPNNGTKLLAAAEVKGFEITTTG